MNIEDVLKIPEGHAVAIMPDPASKKMRIGRVVMITHRGGVLVQLYDRRYRPPRPMDRVWVPYSRVLAHRPSRAGS
jgi:hypothetical protein